jgi:3-deoxy-D-manno-octulosonic acid kinase
MTGLGQLLATAPGIFYFDMRIPDDMRAIDAQLEPLPAGGILYDAARIRKPSAQLFSRDFWAARGALREVSGGRGSVRFITPGDLAIPSAEDTHQLSSLQDTHLISGVENSMGVPGVLRPARWVLRHYRRGGLAAKVLSDSYLWTGAERTRCFREWRLLAELYRRGLPVPAPVAARYERLGFMYRADLITQELPESQTLTQRLAQGPASQELWNAIGRTIARFHAQGVQHADLNAHNILLAADGSVFVLDFDRGRLRERGPWEEQVLARLRRSLEKVTASGPADAFGEKQWRWLLEGPGSLAEHV